MGQSNCTPSLPGLENCIARQYQNDENVLPQVTIINKQPLTLYTSMCETDKQNTFQSQRHYELYQKQQDQLKSYLQSSRMQNLSSSVKRNIEFQNRFLKLPSHIICHIMYFVIDNYISLLLVNSLWYTRLNEAVTKTLSIIEHQFSTQYPFLQVKGCRSSFKKFAIDGQHAGFRLDRNIYAEVQPNFENSLIQLGLQFLQRGNLKTVYYRFAIYKKSAKRRIWVGVDQSSNIFDKCITPFIQPILPFSCGDLVKLPINILNLHGLVEIKKVKWLPPVVEKFEMGIFDNPKHQFCCPPPKFEPRQADWQAYEYFQSPMKRCFDGFEQLKLKECRCYGTSLVISRMTFGCVKEGSVKKAEELLSLKLIVKPGSVINEVKRAALTFDLDNTLEMRLGDELCLYYVRGGDN